MTVWTGTTGAPATPTPSSHHLPPIPDASPRGPAPNGRTSTPYSRQSSASGRQRFTRAPPGGGRSIQLIRRLTPRVSGQPAVVGTTRHGHGTKGACGRHKACARSGATAPPTAPKPQSHRGHIATTRARREQPKGGRRNDRDLRPSGVCRPTARHHDLTVPQQQQPSTEYVPGGHPGTTSRHPSLTSAALDQDRVTMPPQPPGRRSKGARVPLTTRN